MDNLKIQVHHCKRVSPSSVFKMLLLNFVGRSHSLCHVFTDIQLVMTHIIIIICNYCSCCCYF